MWVADIQATLWYSEKRLYGELGATQSKDVSYEEATRQVIDERRSGDDQSRGSAVLGDGGTAAETGAAGVPAQAGSAPGDEAYNPGQSAWASGSHDAQAWNSTYTGELAADRISRRSPGGMDAGVGEPASIRTSPTGEVFDKFSLEHLGKGEGA